MATRNKVNDPNAQRGQVSAPGALQVQNSFGVAKVAPNAAANTLSTLAKFGVQASVQKLQEQAKADFVSGQGLRAAGGELQGGEAPPSRKGFKALDAKLRAQDWHLSQKKQIDEGLNDLDPTEYNASLGDSFKTLLTGDTETDAFLTGTMGQYASDLGRYQASANTKKRNADGVTQATTDVRNHLLSMQHSKEGGDAMGELSARASLEEALSLPTVQNESLRQQLSLDLSIMALEMGDPAVLNFARDNDVQFTPKQERQLNSATAAFNTKETRKRDINYQNDTADFESGGGNAKSLEEFRELRDVYQESWPDRTTDKYLIAQEAAFKRNLAKAAKDKLFSGDYQNGSLAKTGASKADIQKTIDSTNQAILSDPTLDPDVAAKRVKTLWKKNGIKNTSLATELSAGLAVPLQDGVVHPNFEPAFTKALEYYKDAPDLLMKHLPETQRKMFLDVRAATTYGGLELGDAVSTLEAHRVTRKELTRDERADYTSDLKDATDAVLGKGFFNWEHGISTTLTNEAEIGTRLKNVADLALAQGMQDPEAAVEYARQQILDTHEQLGDALVFNDGTPYHERMQIAPNRTEDAMDYMYEQLTIADPSINRADTILLGDPKSDTLLIGVKNEFGVITRTIPAGMKAVGENFRADVVQPEEDGFLQEETAAVENAEASMALRQEAIDTGIYNEETADAALSNTIGSFVLEQRVEGVRESDADAKLIQQYGIESDEELEDFKSMKAAFAPGNALTSEQIKMLQDGDIPGYMNSIGQGTDAGLIGAEGNTDRESTFWAEQFNAEHTTVDPSERSATFDAKVQQFETATALATTPEQAAAIDTVMTAPAVQTEVARLGEELGVDVKQLLTDTAKVETGNLPRAEWISETGAVGMFQILPSTATDLITRSTAFGPNAIAAAGVNKELLLSDPDYLHEQLLNNDVFNGLLALAKYDDRRNVYVGDGEIN